MTWAAPIPLGKPIATHSEEKGFGLNERGKKSISALRGSFTPAVAVGAFIEHLRHAGAASVLQTWDQPDLSLPRGLSAVDTHGATSSQQQDESSTGPPGARGRWSSFLREARRAPWRRGRFELGLKHEQASTVGERSRKEQLCHTWRQPGPVQSRTQPLARDVLA